MTRALNQRPNQAFLIPTHQPFFPHPQPETHNPCTCRNLVSSLSALSSLIRLDSGDICSALHYLLLLAFRGHVIEAHEERPSEADVRVSSGIRVSGRGDLCEIEGDIPAISTFVVTLNTCDVFPGDQLVEKFVLADDNLPEDISTLIPGLLGTEKVPYCPGKEPGECITV